jgi:hypothetical protein
VSKKTKKLEKKLKKLDEDAALVEAELNKTKTVVEALQAVKRVDGDIIADQEQRIRSVYRERDLVVAALSKIFPSHLKRDLDMEEGYKTVVCIHLPKGQAGWHIPDDEVILFDHLTSYDFTSQAAYDTCEYDGHNTYVKYERLNALPDMDSKLNDPANLRRNWAREYKSGHYFSKVSEVEAVAWTGRNVAAVKKFGGDKIKVEAGNGLMLLAGKDGAQDWVPVPVNHWLVHSAGDKSDIWPVEADYFANKYEP